MPGLARGANVAAGVGLKFGVNGSNQTLEKTFQIASDGVGGLDAVRADRMTSAHDIGERLGKKLLRAAAAEAEACPAFCVSSTGRSGSRARRMQGRLAEVCLTYNIFAT